MSFPVQNCDLPIPWTHAEEAYKEYRERYHNQQTLERIAERGGFGIHEIIQLLGMAN